MEDQITHRGYRITPLGSFAMFRIQAPGQGTVPKELSGSYTNLREAKIAIDRSLDSLKGRGRKKNGTEASTSSD